MPEEVLQEAQRAARALKDVISKKEKPVKFNGEQYLEFEDWQMMAKFYGISSKVESSRYVEFGDVKGFEARAVVIRASDGQELSAAEAMCLNDERNWNNKPLFQLKSMAQTRACAKALRTVLAWVVVLAGYKPTPAEEMSEVQNDRGSAQRSYTKPDRQSEPVKEGIGLPYWTGEHHGKQYVFAKCGEYFSKDFLEAVSFSPTKKNPTNYFRQLDNPGYLDMLDQEYKRVLEEKQS